MILVAGLLLLALGILCGLFLVLGAMGLFGAAAGLTLWILFPLFSIGGYLMAAAPAENRKVPMISRISGGALLLLALVAGVALVMHGASIRPAEGGTWALWYVLAIGLVLGATGIASHQTMANT